MVIAKKEFIIEKGNEFYKNERLLSERMEIYNYR